MNPGEASIDEVRTALDPAFEVVLTPVSHPALGAIRIIDSLFAIGRSEPPFVDYPRELLTRLSRRHARIFVEHGAVYVADLDSKNGTTLNGKSVRQTPSRVRAGDELCFGGELKYRVGIEPRARIVAAAVAVPSVSLMLVPQRDDLGLLPIDVRAFPFLVSKTDEVFARYKERFPHQVNYISRRHAHIFVKAGDLYIEDLGSTNGTFVGGVGGKRLDESAHALGEGDIVAFGGDHFVYRVELQHAPEFEPTVTQLTSTPPLEDFDADKTTFVGAAHSFLDIFCVDRALQREDEVNEAAQPSAEAATGEAQHDRAHRPGGAGRPGRFASTQRRWRLLAGELTRTFAGGGERVTHPRAVWWGLAGLVVLAVVALTLYMRGASERQVKDLLASGDYGRAVAVANDYLIRHPADAHVRALASEALLRAKVPDWLAALQAREFDRADALIAQMRDLSQPNPDAASLVNDLKWVGDVERFVVGRGGVDAPIRIYADEDRIRGLLKRWDDDPRNHQ
ncbi:MAG TPA: FHA domain-containing protein, partial [Paraburkholderia sp.]|nr:FHA domain-containing protein [Paraburkholderia sp.]